jgi:hypothetical protein
LLFVSNPPRRFLELGPGTRCSRLGWLPSPQPLWRVGGGGRRWSLSRRPRQLSPLAKRPGNRKEPQHVATAAQSYKRLPPSRLVRLGWAESPVNLTKTEGVVGSLSDIRTIKKIDAKWLLRRRVGDNRLARMNKSGWRIERQPAHHCIGAASVDLNKENGECSWRMQRRKSLIELSQRN